MSYVFKFFFYKLWSQVTSMLDLLLFVHRSSNNNDAGLGIYCVDCYSEDTLHENLKPPPLQYVQGNKFRVKERIRSF